MADPAAPRLGYESRSDWVRLRTLLTLRWLAVLGQTTALVLAAFYIGLRIELGLCFLAIGASVLSNLIAMTVFPENHRLSDRDAMLTLLFDLTQLAFLVFLTGGLNNPFALLILAPVTISATALSLRSTLWLGAAGIGLVVLLGVFHVPLVTAGGMVLETPPLFRLGFLSAIVIGIVFLAIYARRITVESHSMSQALLATQMALAREQKLTDLGGVVAAAAHELGTPLATIKLVSSELADELEGDLSEDAVLIREQADRCRDILRSMGQAGKDDLHIRQVPLSALVRDAAEPHADRGVQVNYAYGADEGEPEGQPIVQRKPEIIHGLRNLIQNAVDFAHEQVWIDGRWGEGKIFLRITDDGEGFPPDLLGRIGDPFLSRRSTPPTGQPNDGYEGMGLGLFIAKTLLERSGAEVRFTNGNDPFLDEDENAGDRRGAIVEVVWPHEAIGLPQPLVGAPLGENQPIPT